MEVTSDVHMVDFVVHSTPYPTPTQLQVEKAKVKLVLSAEARTWAEYIVGACVGKRGAIDRAKEGDRKSDR